MHRARHNPSCRSLSPYLSTAPFAPCRVVLRPARLPAFQPVGGRGCGRPSGRRALSAIKRFFIFRFFVMVHGVHDSIAEREKARTGLSRLFETLIF